MDAIEPRLQYDSLPGVGAPVLTRRLYGHDAQLAFLAASYRTGRLHHALLFEGPAGVGKATAAFHLAQHLLTFPSASHASATLRVLDHSDSSFRQLASGTHPQVLHLSRAFDMKTEKFKTKLSVEEVRRIGHFLSRTNTGAGYRVIIIDSADDMNAAAANALLKNLEEPPLRTVFILIAHGAGRVLPTIRSRCQTLRFNALNHDDLNAAIGSAAPDVVGVNEEVMKLAGGRVRRALMLTALGGLEIIRTADELIAAKRLDVEKSIKLCEAMNGQDADVQYQFLTDYLLSRIALSAMQHAQSVPADGARLLSEFHREAAAKLVDTHRFNLDRKQTLFSLIAALQAGNSFLRE